MARRTTAASSALEVSGSSGATTGTPRAPSASATSSKHHEPWNAPCTSITVVIVVSSPIRVSDSAGRREQETAAGGAAARADHGHLGPAHLALPPVAAQLDHGLVDEPVAVGPPGRELAAEGVERQLAVEGDASRVG